MFPQAILFLNITKTSHFKNKLWWAMKSEYCTKIWNGRDCGASEMNHQQPHQRRVFIQRRWCCVNGGTGRESSIISSLQKTKRLIPTSTFNWANWKKHSHHPKTWLIFHQDNPRPYVSLIIRQKLLQLGWVFWFICHIQQTLHLQISIYFGLYKIILMEKNSIPWTTVKVSCISSLCKKIRSFWRTEL